MTRAFTQSPLKAFTESPLHARGAGVTTPFILQWLSASREWHNSDGSPWGFQGHPGQSQSDDFEDPRVATFMAPITAFGQSTTTEIWADQPESGPTGDRVMVRQSSGGTFNARHTNPGWTVTFGLSDKLYTVAPIQKIGVNMVEGTDPIYGDFFEAHIWADLIQRLKIFPPVSGTATYHDMPPAAPGTVNPFSGNVSVPEPYRTVEKLAGSAVSMEPDEPDYTDLDIFGSTTFPNGIKPAKVLIFWFDMSPDELPNFPTTVNFDSFP